jgi:hypothetical protein
MLGKVQIVFAIFHVFSFLSLWASTVLLLHTYSQKLGKAKFWVIISIPLALYVSVFVTITPFVQSFPNANSSTFRIADVLGYIVPAISSSILFGLPFWMIARTMNYDNSLKDYLIIASSGLVLLQLAWTGNVILASYPPFGFASVSFVGLSSYLILMGIYSSTISISTDQKLRKSIKKYVIEEYRVLDSIATAQMEQDIQNIVVKVVEANLGKTKERTDIEALIKEEDVREYLHDVLSEIYAAKNKERAGNIDS